MLPVAIVLWPWAMRGATNCPQNRNPRRITKKRNLVDVVPSIFFPPNDARLPRTNFPIPKDTPRAGAARVKQRQLQTGCQKVHANRIESDAYDAENTNGCRKCMTSCEVKESLRAGLSENRNFQAMKIRRAD